MHSAIRLVERGLVPKPLLRRGIRRLLRERLAELERSFGRDPERALRAWIEHMRGSPVALVPEAANAQHYEVPPAFFELVLGPRLKYSSGWYAHADATLAEAEDAMLALTCERARLCDGQDVLELGCGWGSLSLWMAERYPHSRILAVSNSAPQREHVLAAARRRGLANLRVLTRDMNEFATAERFDRVVSVEMFEHMRNWEALLARIAGWLRADGKLFLHVFAHRAHPYAFEARDESDWMSRHFFSGGMMPSHELVSRLDAPLFEVERWIVPGAHYARTSEHWLAQLEARRAEVLAVFTACYGRADAPLWYQRWRVFFLACAELFAYRGGREWFVSHHLLEHAPVRRTGAW
ncbi:MAG: class I SAM-dependent methyltransferase [Planctomycetota bacterium]|nr:MAG: class I SAM-dependent methyltransferase [Planctomycetota bacterium]